MKIRLGELNDTELALLARDGNERAFGEIYDRHAPGVAKVLASFAGPDQDVLDDLTQDVFFRVIDRIGSYSPTHPFANWLYTIALNVGRNHVRARNKIVPLDAAQLDSVAEGENRAADMSDALLAVVLVRLVAGLQDHLRDVVSLRTGGGMSYREIAEVLEIPEGTARSRMFNAIKILRGKLGIKDSSEETR